MSLDILDMAREALQTASPWASQLRRYREQKARTAAAWTGIYERRQFVLRHCSTATCVPVRFWPW